MSGIFFALASLATVMAVIYSIMFVVKIFDTSGVLWGLGSVFIPGVSIIWLIMNWYEGQGPFLKCFGFTLLSLFLGGVGAALR